MSNQAKGKKKVKDLKQQREKEKKHSNTESSSSTDEDSKSKRMKRRREKPTCGYFRGSHHDRYFFRKNMEIMTKLLEENNIDVPYFARRGERKKMVSACILCVIGRTHFSHIYCRCIFFIFTF